MAIFRLTTSKVRVQKALLCLFHCKTRPSAPSLASKGLENIPQVPGNRPEVCQNHDARKALSAIFSIKVKWDIFRPRSLKVSVQNVLLSPFHWKPRPSRVSLESLGLESFPQVPEYRSEVGQNHDARTPVSATLYVLSDVGLYFGLEARKCAFKNLCCVNFTANHGHQELV